MRVKAVIISSDRRQQRQRRHQRQHLDASACRSGRRRGRSRSRRGSPRVPRRLPPPWARARAARGAWSAGSGSLGEAPQQGAERRGAVGRRPGAVRTSSGSGSTCSVLTRPGATPRRICVVPTLHEHRAFLGTERHLGEHVEGVADPRAEGAHALQYPGEREYRAEYQQQRQRHLAEATQGPGMCGRSRLWSREHRLTSACAGARPGSPRR